MRTPPAMQAKTETVLTASRRSITSPTCYFGASNHQGQTLKSQALRGNYLKHLTEYQSKTLPSLSHTLMALF